MEAEVLQEKFNEHRDTSNIEYFFPDYRSILEDINSATEGYTESDDVVEKFTYS